MGKRNHILVDDETHRAIKIMAVKKGLTMGQVVKELLKLAEGKEKDYFMLGVKEHFAQVNKYHEDHPGQLVAESRDKE